MGSSAPRTESARRVFKEVLARAAGESGAFDEAAFPAYAHENLLIDRVFWGRLSAVERYFAAAPPGSVLDFGCGGGIMSFILAGLADRVIAFDIDTAAFERARSCVRFPERIELTDLRGAGASRWEGAFDAVVALDVLEHVTDLPGTLELLRRVLKPGGVAVISGPTENLLYRLGRRVAGRRFTGDYHVTDIGRIEDECRRRGAVKGVATIYPFLPLFRIFSLRFSDSVPEAG